MEWRRGRDELWGALREIQLPRDRAELHLGPDVHRRRRALPAACGAGDQRHRVGALLDRGSPRELRRVQPRGGDRVRGASTPRTARSSRRSSRPSCRSTRTPTSTRSPIASRSPTGRLPRVVDRALASARSPTAVFGNELWLDLRPAPACPSCTNRSARRGRVVVGPWCRRGCRRSCRVAWLRAHRPGCCPRRCRVSSIASRISWPPA